MSNADYLTRPLRLSPTEATALIVALRALRDSAPEATREVVDRALGKLETAAAEGAAAHQVDLADGVDRLADLRASLQRAVASGRQVRLTYHVPTRDEESERVVDPRGVVSTGGLDYLDAWCHSAEAPWWFRLDRIHEAQVLASAVVTDPQPPRDLAEGLLAPGEGAAPVTLLLDPAARWVPDYYPVDSARQRAGGRLEVRMRVADPLAAAVPAQADPSRAGGRAGRVRRRLPSHARGDAPPLQRPVPGSVARTRVAWVPNRLPVQPEPPTRDEEPMTSPLVTLPGGWELIVIVLVIVFLFGAKKLPGSRGAPARRSRSSRTRPRPARRRRQDTRAAGDRVAPGRGRQAAAAALGRHPGLRPRRWPLRRRPASLRPSRPSRRTGRPDGAVRPLPRAPRPILKAALAVAVVFIAALFFFDPIFAVVLGPYHHAQSVLGEDVTQPVVTGPGGPFLLYFKLCGLAALVLTSPYWLHQIWGFILPGLHANERKWSRVFAAVAGPAVPARRAGRLPHAAQGLQVLIGFTPADLTNLVEFNDYLSFFSRTLLVFGIAFEIPVFIVLLNLAGVVSGAWLGAHRSWIIISVFVFAAIATPSTDPFTMYFMAIPMVALFGVSEVIARVTDRRRAARRAHFLGGDKASAR
ncbi:MAG: twin-arginine translocase subunit TatC [Nocardioides sp.]